MGKKYLIFKLAVVISLSIGLIPVTMHNHSVGAFSNQVIQHGAVGDDVIELQSRLQYLGFYNKKIDGVFGWSTYWALRNFQYEFGLTIDGLAGPQTKAKLVKASNYNENFVKDQINKGNKFTHYGGMDLNKQTKPRAGKGQPKSNQQKGKTPPANQNQGNQQTRQPAQQPQAQQPQAQQPQAQQPQAQQPQAQQPQAQQPQAQQPQAQQPQAQAKPAPAPKKPTAVNTPNGFSQNDIQLMANAVYGEARGEPYVGQVAVAAVILNRLESATFPNTVSGVIFEPLAFTAVADGQIWLTPNEQAKKAVLDAINGWDPTGNATYYFNPDTATSSWIWGRPQIKKIGKHIFCR